MPLRYSVGPEISSSMPSAMMLEHTPQKVGGVISTTDPSSLVKGILTGIMISTPLFPQPPVRQTKGAVCWSAIFRHPSQSS